MVPLQEASDTVLMHLDAAATRGHNCARQRDDLTKWMIRRNDEGRFS